MAVLTVTQLSRAGKNLDTLKAAAAGGGDKFTNTGKEYLYVDNADSGAAVVTLVYAATTDGQAITNRTVSVGAGKHYLIGPFPIELYNDANGQVSFTYSQVTSLSVAAVQVP